jgi:hypothetical protein
MKRTETVRGVLGWIGKILAAAHPGTLLLLLVGVACLAFSASDSWWPSLRIGLGLSSTEPSRGREKRLGFSAHLIVRIRDAAAIRRKYVFDTGAPEGARIAFYQSASDRFVLQATGAKPMVLKSPLAMRAFPSVSFSTSAWKLG